MQNLTFFVKWSWVELLTISLISLEEECIGSINLSKTRSILLLAFDDCEIQCSCILYFVTIQTKALTLHL